MHTDYRKNLWNLLPAALFVPFLIVSGPWLYQVNSLKLALGLGAAILLWAFAGLKLFTDPTCRKVEIPILFLLLLVPTVVGIPGALLHDIPYNFPYELGTDLISVAWALGILCIGGTGAYFAVQMSAGAVFALLGIAITGMKFGILPEILLEERLTFGNPNYGAAAALLVLPIFLAFSLPRKKNCGKWKWSNFQKANALFTAMSLLLLLQLGSRAGLILGPALVAVLAILIFIREYSPSLSAGLKTKWTILGSGCLTAIIIGISTLYWEHIKVLATLSAWEGRIIPWQAAWESIKAAPLLGHGLGSSYGLFFRFLPGPYQLFNASESYNHVHNEHLEILQETGIIGYTIVMGGILLLTVFLIRKWLKAPLYGFKGRLSLALAASIVVFYIHGTISVAQRMAIANLPFYLNVGLGIVLVLPRSWGSRWKTRKPALYVLIGLILVLGAGITLTPWLSRQFRYVQAGKAFNAQPDQMAYKQFFNRLQSTKDVYALHGALIAAIRMGDSEGGLYLAQRLSGIMPNYRHVNYYRALFLAMEGLHEEALEALEIKKEKTFGHIPSLALRAVLSAQLQNYSVFKESCHYAILHAVLIPGEYGNPRKVQAGIKQVTLNQGLIASEIDEGYLEIRLSDQWTPQLYNHLSGNGDPTFDPVGFTLQLIAGSKYGRLPLNDPSSASQEQISKAYEQYLEHRKLGIRSTSISNSLTRIRQNGAADQGRLEELKNEIQAITERRELLYKRMAEVVDLDLLGKRQNTVNIISKFVVNMNSADKLLNSGTRISKDDIGKAGK